MSDSRGGNLVGLGGSLREHSLSAAAMRQAMALADEAGFTTDALDLRVLALPMFVPDQAIEDYPADAQASLRHMLKVVRGADAMLWVSPTYHGAMSGAFKNAIDFMELLAGDQRPYLQGCSVGLVTVSDDAPQASMAHCVHELRAWLAPTRVTLDSTDFTPTLALSKPAPLRRLRRLVMDLREFQILRLSGKPCRAPSSTEPVRGDGFDR